MTGPTDEEIMQAYQLGDQKAFEELYRRHSAKVYGFVRSKISSENADDVFQAIFMKLHTSRSHYDPKFPFTPWLFTVCRSVLTDAFRKQGRNREDATDEIIEMGIETHETAQVPNLQDLPSNQREAVRLRFQDDLTFDEIAKKLETSPANVRQLISRAIRKLRKKIYE